MFDPWPDCRPRHGVFLNALTGADLAGEVGARQPGHPAETGYLLPYQNGFPDDAFDGADPSGSEAFRAGQRRVKEELAISDTCYAVDIAARLSVDLGSLGADGEVTGHGVFALTACAREHGRPAGVLPVRRCDAQRRRAGL
ncbi:hypothetical protein AB0A94_11815 [Streptomyces sp. NPDC044984]|uniref:hypothetical protein n=1 Tax=Streptomyces sp. NPDC044984 TaxID=3154335 RepID=UPI0034004487